MPENHLVEDFTTCLADEGVDENFVPRPMNMVTRIDRCRVSVKLSLAGDVKVNNAT